MPVSESIPVAYLFSPDCPSHAEGLALLRDAAAAAGVAVEIEAVAIVTDDQARERGFAGSPTYLIDGRDLFAVEGPPHAAVHDACRIYTRPDGRVAPLPHRDDLITAVGRAAARTGAP